MLHIQIADNQQPLQQKFDTDTEVVIDDEDTYSSREKQSDLLIKNASIIRSHESSYPIYMKNNSRKMFSQ